MKYFLSLFSFFLIASVSAQFTVDAELRPRFEYRHGYKFLFDDTNETAAAVTQRTRIKTTLKKEKLTLHFSFQDLRVWGDTPQLTFTDRNGLQVNAAWADIALDSSFHMKIGRQPLAYDDQRILGEANWAQQSRVHDALVLRHAKGSFKAHLGLAYNQSSQRLTGTFLDTPGTYKTMQYLWLHNDFGDVDASFLVLNNGQQGTITGNAETRFNQTIGTHLKFNLSNIVLATNVYLQTGKDVRNNDLSAYLLGLSAMYKANDNLNITLGGELQSGNDNNTISEDTNNAFTPFYGTNHRYNGHMDYFYTGNHLNSVGLFNLFLKFNGKINDKSSYSIAFHNFASAADFTEKQLGNEVDLAYKIKLQKDVSLSMGYSQMFAADGLKLLQSVPDPAINNWGYMMLTVNPNLFTSKM